MSLFNGICVKFLYRELKSLEMALILNCAFKEETEPSISKSFDDQASQKIRRYDNKKVSYLPLNSYTSRPLYIHTSITAPHPAFGHPLPQGAKEKTLAAQLPSCLAAFNGGVHD